MKFSAIANMLKQSKEQEKASGALKTEASGFNLATDGGYIKVLKYLLFVLFGFYNARLFLTTVPGWEKYVTAVFALLGECTALYCFNNFTKSTGRHKTALGVFGILLFLFAFTHASISYFRMESGDLSGPIRFYCERVAFPVLFGLLLLAAIIIPLMHWRTKIAQAQAEAAVTIASGRAQLVADTAAMRDEHELERARLDHWEEEIQLGNEYVGKMKRFAAMKKDEYAALLDLPEQMRSQVASQLGIDLAALPSAPPKPSVQWQGGKQVGQRPN